MLTREQAIKLARRKLKEHLANSNIPHSVDTENTTFDEWLLEALIEASRGDLHLKLQEAKENAQ